MSANHVMPASTPFLPFAAQASTSIGAIHGLSTKDIFNPVLPIMETYRSALVDG